MSKWSPLIYGRTYEVDFRLIAMPEYFDTEARKWVENYILATTQIPEKLPGNPRWSLFTNKNYCVVATTCMVQELFANGLSQQPTNMATDFRGRPVYAFIGYVARNKNGQFPPLPAYDELKLEKFQSSYQRYVEKCWDVKPYQPESKHPILASEDENISYQTFSETNGSVRSNNCNINLLQDSRLLFPEIEREILWAAVTDKVIKSEQHSISVCLGLPSQREAVNSPFLNATASNVSAPISVPIRTTVKPVEPTPSRSREPVELSTRPTYVADELSDNYSEKSDSSIISIEECVGSIIGGIAGRFIRIPLSGIIAAGSFPAIALGAGIGWIAIGAVTNKGLGGAIVNKTSELLGSLTGSSNRDRNIDRIENVNNLQSNSKTQNQNFGFKAMDKSNDKQDEQNQENQKREWF
jgi:hypothetical protein